MENPVGEAEHTDGMEKTRIFEEFCIFLLTWTNSVIE